MDETQKWTNLTRANMSYLLAREGFKVSRNVVRKLLKNNGYVKRKPLKNKAGGGHVDRNSQFERIAELKDIYTAEGNPILSVDTNKKEKTGAPCYLTKFWDSCRHNSFTYAADGRCPERPASATTTHKSRFVITTSLAGRLFGMQFLLLSRAASTRRISELPCRLSGTKNHHFAKLRFPDFQRR
ncbi:ISAzo13-like element transposase-related protein [Bathymodiolus japonicus methanotrophic gill symbiont]|uniref:ISAzo13-like element transposase-related protein n=1 Tax=Bathymodiolus japonicus methanotrophic gill symbiont TaxID=113269 RepID=UPI001E3EF226|nr:hypothetical protein [Bathymodiolus japonicus methanotrophic gill symbiont]